MNRTILIIDDDDILRKTLAHGLRNENFEVLSANSAEEGEVLLSRMKVDAIVLDRMMTGQDGLSFLKDLRNQGNRTPVIMLTAMTGPENTIDGLSCGADDYLVPAQRIERERGKSLSGLCLHLYPAADYLQKVGDDIVVEYFIVGGFKAVQRFSAHGDYGLELGIARKLYACQRRVALDYIQLAQCGILGAAVHELIHRIVYVQRGRKLLLHVHTHALGRFAAAFVDKDL